MWDASARPEALTLDIDATIVIAYSENEQAVGDHASPAAVLRGLSALSDHDQRGGRLPRIKQRNGHLSNESINKTLIRLGQILDSALERDLIERNPLRVNPRKRKLKVDKPNAVYLDDDEHIRALLDAPGELDKAARRDRRHIPRRAMLATLVLAGLRIGESCSCGGAVSISAAAASPSGRRNRTLGLGR